MEQNFRGKIKILPKIFFCRTEKFLPKILEQQIFFRRNLFFRHQIFLAHFWFGLVGMVILTHTAILEGNSTYTNPKKLKFGIQVQLTKTR